MLAAEGHLDPAFIRGWNEELPDQPLTVAYKNEGWPGIDFSSMPHFHFFSEGRLIASYSGWSKGPIHPEIVKALREMDVLEESP